MEASSSSTSETTPNYVPEEWDGMNFDEREQLLARKEDELEQFENEVQEHGDNNGWNTTYMERATKSLFAYLRVIEKLRETLVTPV